MGNVFKKNMGESSVAEGRGIQRSGTGPLSERGGSVVHGRINL